MCETVQGLQDIHRLYFLSNVMKEKYKRKNKINIIFFCCFDFMEMQCYHPLEKNVDPITL